jgi:molybdopterin/thiamine biosynthesis adenylyltransferase
MTRKRWWETTDRSIEAEATWFEEAGLDFELDKELFERSGAVVFRGVLRLDDETTPADVHYPPGYAAGAHPIVTTPDLDLGRHQAPDGSLCLDHPVFGETQPMYGAEAAGRAQRLWGLCVNDREQLRIEEADAADPRANYYDYEPESAIVMIDTDVAGYDAGFVTLAVTELRPLRAGVTQVRATLPTVAESTPGPLVQPFAGKLQVICPWRRIDEPPPVKMPALGAWLEENHRQVVEDQTRFARDAARVPEAPQTPALLAFVYADEGPGRDETHDAWLFVAIDPRDGGIRVPRAFHIRSDERWLRQPQLKPLEGKRVGIVGVGALGSPIADLLSKAGVGSTHLVDNDILTIGNRVRHQLDLSDVGRYKVSAMEARARRANPWLAVSVGGERVGAAIVGVHSEFTQRSDDAVAAQLGACDVIVNATANSVTGSYLSVIGAETGKPVIHVWVSAGAWGGRILIQRPGQGACLDCLVLTQEDDKQKDEDEQVVPSVDDDPEVQEVMERGCADPTFTGPGFDISAAAAAATRVAVQVLLEDDGGYPAPDFDLLTIGFRDATSAVPTARATRLPVHPRCRTCQANG